VGGRYGGGWTVVGVIPSAPARLSLFVGFGDAHARSGNSANGEDGGRDQFGWGGGTELPRWETGPVPGSVSRDVRWLLDGCGQASTSNISSCCGASEAGSTRDASAIRPSSTHGMGLHNDGHACYGRRSDTMRHHGSLSDLSDSPTPPQWMWRPAVGILLLIMISTLALHDTLSDDSLNLATAIGCRRSDPAPGIALADPQWRLFVFIYRPLPLDLQRSRDPVSDY
jgi:hypothetical protein